MEETVFIYSIFSELKFKYSKLPDNLTNCVRTNVLLPTSEQMFGNVSDYLMNCLTIRENNSKLSRKDKQLVRGCTRSGGNGVPRLRRKGRIPP